MRAIVCSLLIAGVWLGACAFDWDSFDPRVAGASTSASGGGAATTGTGGQTSATGGAAAGGAGGIGGGGAGGSGGAPLGPWSTPTVISELLDTVNNVSQDDPVFTADVLELYFNSNRPGGLGGSDIWRSTRLSRSDPWGTPENVPELSSSFGEGNQVVSPDGLTIWLSSSRGNMGTGSDIYVATRMDRNSAWSTPVLVPELSSTSGEAVNAVSGDGLIMIMESTRAGGTSYDMYLSTRSSTTTPWSTPTLISELNTVDGDRQAWMHPDGLVLYFDRDVGGDLEDLFMTMRASITDPWDPPVAVSELNTLDEESDAWLSPDLRYIVFSQGPEPSQIVHSFR